MTDKERTPRAHVTPPDALALPHVVEAIAMCLDDQKDFGRFLHAIPRSLWTPALTAFLACTTVMPSSVSTNWPHIALLSMELPPLVLTLLAATLPLRPRFQLQCPIGQAAPLASLVAVVGPAINSVTLHLNSNGAANGRGQAISSLLLQRCPHLPRVVVCVKLNLPTGNSELSDLLAVVAHRHVEDLTIALQRAPPELGYLLAAWLSTAPATKLRLVQVAQIDHDAAIAFCDALQANTTLRELSMYNARAFGGFHGRTLPVSLKTLEWNARTNSVVDDATMTDLATAVGPTQLERLECSVFGQLATCPAAAPMLAQLQWLLVSGLNAGDMEALIAGLLSVPALMSLALVCNCDLSFSTELLMETLATTCVHLETLHVSDEQLTRREVVVVLSGTLDLPRLTSLTMAIRLSVVLDVLPELVAAGRQLRTLHLNAIVHGEMHGGAGEAKRALYRALALTQNVPFVVEALPEDTDAFVVDVLGPRADRGDRCRLSFT
ncbi:hypothetical protein SPRG_16029 [Saprolegnia parasitica CBS 223.65]|uniref:F-box domain-containing protein n=1 Tax=Saprolegnia parasitica (strain CBS 223.65) TaxID=695850 RepID=A0A067BPC6_SAPPC|nr:hypothetical protein SPRG_16029 [Saprolegnia parasitica CBS 223.65]KDO18610.1 hypothetical protein SPRG_16029 [Saprolegnia parasitica CBS 223.65]|eukprot:XP_012210678.1 hypothetical protein SPRG_16029 [Saprolegnia parasitica CBS 223.65]